MKKTLRREHMGYVYILPWIIGFLVFQLYPLAASLYYSFTSYNITSAPVWVGLENYVTMFTKDSQFFSSLLTTLKYVFMSVPMKICFALLVAVILNQKIRFINFYRTVLYIPSIFGGSVAVAILWRFLFMDSGLINQILRALGVPAVQWLSSPKVLFLAALKQVPEDLHEAARIDGASRVCIFFRITLPMITPVLFFNLLMQIVNAFQDFTGAFVITNGGPLKSTYLFALKLYDEAFNYYKMGYASALSWVLFVMILLFTIVFFRFSEAATYYEDGGKM